MVILSNALEVYEKIRYASSHYWNHCLSSFVQSNFRNEQYVLLLHKFKHVQLSHLLDKRNLDQWNTYMWNYIRWAVSLTTSDALRVLSNLLVWENWLFSLIKPRSATGIPEAHWRKSDYRQEFYRNYTHRCSLHNSLFLNESLTCLFSG